MTHIKLTDKYFPLLAKRRERPTEGNVTAASFLIIGKSPQHRETPPRIGEGIDCQGKPREAAFSKSSSSSSTSRSSTSSSSSLLSYSRSSPPLRLCCRHENAQVATDQVVVDIWRQFFAHFCLPCLALWRPPYVWYLIALFPYGNVILHGRRNVCDTSKPVVLYYATILNHMYQTYCVGYYPAQSNPARA